MSWTRGTCGACLSHSEVCQRSPMGQLQKIQNPKGQLSRRGLSVAFPIDAPRNSDVHVYGHGRNSANSCEATRQNMSFWKENAHRFCQQVTWQSQLPEKWRWRWKLYVQELNQCECTKNTSNYWTILHPGFSKFTQTSRQLRSSFCAYRNIRHNKCLKFKVTRRIGNSVGNQKIGRTRIILDLSTPDSWFFCWSLPISSFHLSILSCHDISCRQFFGSHLWFTLKPVDFSPPLELLMRSVLHVPCRKFKQKIFRPKNSYWKFVVLRIEVVPLVWLSECNKSNML